MARFIENVPAVKRIFHPSDFSPGSQQAFAHALKFALLTQAELTILHASEGRSDSNWANFPAVRHTLEAWGLLAPGSDKTAVPGLGIDVKKVRGEDRDPVRSALLYLGQRPTDLIVLATSQQGGRMQWLSKSVSQPIARNSGEMTLFVPSGVTGFISPDSGEVSLNSILLPVASEQDADDAIEAAMRIGAGLHISSLELHLLYVGEAADMPRPHQPTREGLSWHRHNRQGDVVAISLALAQEVSADLIIMTTSGHDGFLDMLRGSTTERVLRGSDCPVLAIPLSGHRY